MKRWLYKILRTYFPAGLWLSAATYLFLMPTDGLETTSLIDIPYADKWVHMALFFVLLQLWLMPNYLRSNAVEKKTGWLALLLAVLYGITIEIVQGNFTANRSADPWDVLADTAGAILGLLLLPWVVRRFILPQSQGSSAPENGR